MDTASKRYVDNILLLFPDVKGESTCGPSSGLSSVGHELMTTLLVYAMGKSKLVGSTSIIKGTLARVCYYCASTWSRLVADHNAVLEGTELSSN